MMSTHAADKKRTARVRDKYISLGIDAEGTHHIYRTVDESVHVIDPDAGRERVYDVDGRSLDDYMAAIDEWRGWERRDYGLGIIGSMNRVLGRD